MKYRQIKADFWDDNYIIDLKKTEKLLFLYLFTNPKVNLSGIYELPDRTICYTLDLTLDELKKIKDKFQKDDKYYFYQGWVFISNFSSHNIYSSAKPVIYSFIKDFNNIPVDIKNYFFNELKLNYEIPINNWESVMVMDKVKDNRVGARVVPRVAMRLNEDVNPEDVPL
jgi:hypothetical protein